MTETEIKSLPSTWEELRRIWLQSQQPPNYFMTPPEAAGDVWEKLIKSAGAVGAGLFGEQQIIPDSTSIAGQYLTPRTTAELLISSAPISGPVMAAKSPVMTVAKYRRKIIPILREAGVPEEKIALVKKALQSFPKRGLRELKEVGDFKKAEQLLPEVMPKAHREQWRGFYNPDRQQIFISQRTAEHTTPVHEALHHLQLKFLTPADDERLFVLFDNMSPVEKQKLSMMSNSLIFNHDELLPAVGANLLLHGPEWGNKTPAVGVIKEILQKYQKELIGMLLFPSLINWEAENGISERNR